MKDLGLHIYDVVQNSIRAEASEIGISINEDTISNMYSIQIQDNGKGIEPKKLNHVTDAFYTTRKTRKVGLGLPLLKQNAELSNGQFEIKSTLNKGTWLTVTFELDHLDRPYAGDLVTTFGLLITTNPEININYSHKTTYGEFHLSTKNITDALGNITINQPGVITMIKELIAYNLEKIKAETTKIYSDSSNVI
ncbi:MAG: ATP-binding protein [Bacteroidetes bacterium]|jgi:anti-sigma regulatory factor (Ser/Thr protein kinase)|nr:ATP-binding protein [Bacteroidota bacterium]